MKKTTHSLACNTFISRHKLFLPLVFFVLILCSIASVNGAAIESGLRPDIPSVGGKDSGKHFLESEKSFLLTSETSISSSERALAPGAAHRAGGHPFLIVREEMYPELRSRANQSPWKEMRDQAISYLNRTEYNTSGSYSNKYKTIQRTAGAAALLFILDPANGERHKRRVLEALLRWDDARASMLKAINQPDYGSRSALFLSILAFDIIYEHLSSQEKQRVEEMLQSMVNALPNDSGLTFSVGCRGLWALFRGDDDNSKKLINQYRNRLSIHLTEDGTINDSNGYMWFRYTSQDRGLPGAGFMDVLEFTGRDTYYDDHRYRTFYEYMFQGGITPSLNFVDFGATPPFGDAVGRLNFRISSLHRFSETAAEYASWAFGSRAFHPSLDDLLMTFILMDKPPSPPRSPDSGIWKNGGAAFWERNADERSLMAALWNPTSSGGQSFKSVNAIFMAAYGETVLLNSGWNLWGQPVAGYEAEFPWSWLYNNARSSNTVLINDSDHQTSKRGDGIDEGFVNENFDYASGNSGPALPNGHHQRNFVFVHPQDGRVGYFLLFDEIKADNTSHQADVLLHPNSRDYSVITNNAEYRWAIKNHSDNKVFLNVFLGTPPASTTMLRGGIADRDTRNNFVGMYLRSRYDTDDAGKVNVVTVLFPSDARNPKANMARLTGAGYSGARVDLGDGIVDHVLESNGSDLVDYNGISFRGLAMVHRVTGSNTGYYFVRKGNEFDDGKIPRRGFYAQAPITAYFRGTNGSVISPGTDVTFYHPGISGVRVDGSGLAAAGSGDGWIRVHVPAGTHQVELMAGDNFAYGPTAPSDLQATVISASQIDLTWTHTGIDVDGFQIERRSTGEEGTYRRIATVTAEIRSYSDVGLSGGTEYSYRVHAYNQASGSPYSNEALARTEGSIQPVPLEGWQNVGISMQADTFTAFFEVTPITGSTNGVLGFSDGESTEWRDLATTVRFFTNGLVDAYNGTEYAAEEHMTYSAETTYQVRMVVDVPSRTYSVFVKEKGAEAESLIADNYIFRSTRSDVSRLNTFAHYAHNSQMIVDRLRFIDDEAVVYPDPDPKPVPTIDIQSIPLVEGWNLISGYVVPSEPSLEKVFLPIRDNLVAVRDQDGNVFRPHEGVNSIGNWAVSKAYQVFVTQSDTLLLAGESTLSQDRSVILKEGWNMIPYLDNEPIPVKEFFSSVRESLEMVKSNDGKIYWPDFDIDTIGDLVPGQGYEVFMLAERYLEYPGQLWNEEATVLEANLGSVNAIHSLANRPKVSP